MSPILMTNALIAGRCDAYRAELLTAASFSWASRLASVGLVARAFKALKGLIHQVERVSDHSSPQVTRGFQRRGGLLEEQSVRPS